MSGQSIGEQALSPAKAALLRLRELQAKVGALEKARSEPIAIIGMACRFPGGCNDTQSFWQLLRKGEDASIDIPATRWNVDGHYDPDANAPGKMYVKKGYFLREADQFDPVFFGISPREAAEMDPQQRLLLEVTWEALEDSGLRPSALAGSAAGVFVGIMNMHFAQLRAASTRPSDINPHTVTGGLFSVASGRISFALGLQGPNIAVDTACSSSLVALHLACQSLRAGECDVALAGGVNLVLLPEAMIERCKAKMLSARGVCRTFDAGADGYAIGEGCGMIVLKRLSDAVRDRDPILATVLGTAVNHDGPSSGLTVPNGPAQQALLRRALANAGIHASEVSYVEAHGTGTPLGDPIEINAIDAVFKEGRESKSALWVGSAKTNIGHLESAAGIAGVIKVVEALRHEEIPPHLHMEIPNPHIGWNELSLRIARESTPWPATAVRRVAGVSSFGVSGTNAHAVVSEGPASKARPKRDSVPWRNHVLCLSARSAEALKVLAQAWVDEIALAGEISSEHLSDLAYTTSVRRDHHEHRLAVVVHEPSQIVSRISTFLRHEADPYVAVGRVEAESAEVIFAFGEPGLRWKIAVQRLLQDPMSSVFAERLRQLDTELHEKAGFSLLDTLTRQETASLAGVAHQERVTSGAVQVALVDQWRVWGIVPRVAVGYGVGEVAAAYAVSEASWDDAVAAMVLQASGLRGGDSRSSDRGEEEAKTVRFFGLSGIPGESRWHDPASLHLVGTTALVEIGPVPVSMDRFRAAVRSEGSLRCSPLSANVDLDPAGIQETLALLYGCGAPISWSNVYSDGDDHRCVRIPRHPFIRHRCWFSRSSRLPRDEAPLSALLDRRIHLPGRRNWIFQSIVGPDSPPYIGDHRFSGQAVIPAAHLLSMVVAACESIGGPGKGVGADDVVLLAACVIPDGRHAVVQIQLDSTAFEIHAALDGPEIEPSWEKLCVGRLRGSVTRPAGAGESKQSVLSAWKDARQVDAHQFYHWTDTLRFPFAGRFRGIQEIWIRGPEVLARIALPEVSATRDADDYEPHPAMLDACFQVALVPIFAQIPLRQKALLVPWTIDSFEWYGHAGGSIWCRMTSENASAPENGHQAVTADLRLFDESGQAVGTVRGLRVRAVEPHQLLRGATPQERNWAYELSWREQAGADVVRTVSGAGSWLVLADDGGVGDALASMFGGRGDRWMLVRRGEQYTRDSSQRVKIVATDAAMIRRVVDEFLAEHGTCTGVIHLWNLDSGDVEHASGAGLMAAQAVGCGSVLHLVQTLTGGVSGGKVPRLWVVTAEAQATGHTDSRIQVGQSAVWGLGRVVRVEHPELWGGLLDLPGNASADEQARVVLDHIQRTGSEDQVAVRDGRRYVARLVRSELAVAATAPVPVKAQATYLVTGGTGALGLQVVRWLVEKGATHVLLTSRSGASAASEAELVELERPGTQLRVVRADVADRSTMAAVFADIAQTMPPLRGVIHAAGVLDDGVIRRQEWRRFESVMGPKIKGAWNLHELTRGLPIDFFILFSSAAGIFGSAGQSNYAAANVFMDSLAHHRRNRGLPALSIDWGPWSQAGMAVRQGRAERTWEIQGIHPMQADSALRILEGLLRQKSAPQIGILDIAWIRYLEHLGVAATAKFFAEVSRRPDQTGHGTPPPGDEDLLSTLRGADPATRPMLLTDYLSKTIATILALPKGAVVDPSQGFSRMGMDSLLALELRNLLRGHLRQEFASTLIFDYPSISVLVPHLLGAVLADPATAEVEGLEETSEDDLSDEEIVSRLAKRLGADNG